MKNTRFYLVLLALFGLSALTINAAQLASAKVLSVTGTVTSHAEDGVETPLTVGTILKQGDSVTTTGLSNALLVFSNGSELVVEADSSLKIAELTQDAFSGNKSYEQLQADPSKSQALLELSYGKVSGHVKKLRPGSEFFVESPLGTAAIRGTNFVMGLYFDSIRGELVFFVQNKDGKVDLISRVAGTVEFGRGNVSTVGFAPGAKNPDTYAVPPAHSIIVRLSENDPYFKEIVNFVKNIPPHAGLPTIIIETDTDPDAEDVELISPEG
ncbi:MULTISPECIES: FecR domain-containing protein [unclassified Lentimonas]|uniref:FecR family protein n=1 Tax=unclassified Lentimonas TaxID=2630993 RepID=UPI0013283CAA|nr:MULTISPECIES: FecR domain-containing protein [unclassified Lentimonas]CAA6680058.1 Unannotated [Lentimonas sp. CC4]CAA6685178.1 Unannotated [Lentimonas sp. CC6]CAA7075096.1 Unannotated [Lentimonas sp. CC4]CAA7168444.1 Unannotated [Lentimonas sp. CC21]CAA7182121.1 Unannotated [Lentimonas sp. CC8]